MRAAGRLHLRYNDTGGERYWFAIEYRREIDPVTGKRKTRRIYCSLKVKGKKARRTAERVLHEVELELAKQGAPLRANIADASPVRVLIDEYLSAIEGTVKEKTLVVYRHALGHFAATYGMVPLSDLEPLMFERWRKSLRSRFADASVNMMLRAVKTCFRWGLEKKIIRENPTQGVKTLRIPEPSFPPWITFDDFERFVLPAVEDTRHRVAFGLAMWAGLRRDEACHLLWRQVFLGRGEILIEATPDWSPKNGKGRAVPVLPPLRDELDAAPRRGPYVLGVGDKPADGSAIGRRWREVIQTVHAEHAVVPAVNFHGLRHSFASNLAKLGMPIVELQALLGHSSITMTQRYAHVQPHQAVERAHQLLAGMRDEPPAEKAVPVRRRKG
jgi:integrase